MSKRTGKPLDRHSAATTGATPSRPEAWWSRAFGPEFWEALRRSLGAICV